MTSNGNQDLPRPRAWELIVVIAATALKLWLVEARRLVALAWAQHDDVWFLDKARSIMDGQWLGSYDSLTLIKGPGFPLWLALVSSLHLPVLLMQQFLYAVACFATCRALAPALRSPAVRVALFGLLLFNPLTYTDDTSTRLTREAIYPALALLVFAGVAGTLLRLEKRAHATGWALLCGLSLTALWHTREEGIWILPMLVVAAAGTGVWVSRNWKERRLYGMMVVAIPVCMTLFARVAIVLINGWKYDSFVVSEFSSPDFLRAYGSLTHVRQHPSRPRIPVPLEVRERVYAISPAFTELRPHLEGEVGRSWVQASGVQGNGEIGGAWFQWAFREAIDKVGYYARGAAAVREYHARLSREIEKARLEGRLDARRPRSSLRPPILKGQRREILRIWKDGMLVVLTFAHFDLNSLYSQGTDAELQEFARVTRSRLAPREEQEPSGVPARDRLRLRLLVAIARVYQNGFAPLFALALLACLAGAPRLLRRGRDWRVLTLIAALLAAVAARVLILAAIHVIAFWSFTGAYEAPAHPLLIVAGFLLATVAVNAFRDSVA